MDSKRVRRISESGTDEFPSVGEAARRTPGTSQNLISRAALCGYTHAGYKWEYTDSINAKNTIEEKPTLSEQQIREMFDMRTIVFKELAKLQKGEFWRDGDFVRKFHGKLGYRSILESPEASIYRGKNQGSVFWSHPESIAKMKNEGILI